MRIRVGIVGYGNLGKAAEKELLKNHKLKLVAIFSRRNTTSTFGTMIEPLNNYVLYKNKIDIMLMCGSSKSDILDESPIIAKHFDTINTFDTHTKIKDFKQSLDKVCKSFGTRSIICCGWDPGIFSIVRGLFLALSQKEPTTFWGKGISLGHSDAIRSLDGVTDAVQFTIPNTEAKKMIMQGKCADNKNLHFRDCYVVADKDHNKIEKEIKSIPNYFKGQKVNVTFVSAERLLKLKNNLSHKGCVISNFKLTEHKNKLVFSVQMQSNPAFTARVMAAYLQAIINLKANKISGAFTPLDIPISYLFNQSNNENLLSTICWHLIFTIRFFNGTILLLHFSRGIYVLRRVRKQY